MILNPRHRTSPDFFRIGLKLKIASVIILIAIYKLDMYQQLHNLRYLASWQKQGIAASEHEAVFPWQCHDELSEKMGANFSLLPLLQLHIFPQNHIELEL
jgi:hypothetical protein